MAKVTHLASIESTPDLTEQVYARLLNAICDGELPPGSRLTQEECAASFNVSRQPVLQALRLLKQDGLVVDAGRRGLMVTPLDATVVAQIYEVRTALDALAARLAAQRSAKLDAALVVTNVDQYLIAGLASGNRQDPDLAFARLQALRGRFNSVVNRVSNDVRERVTDHLDHFAIEFDVAALNVHEHLLAKFG